ncbi:MAG: PAS domain-containing sensor histidine kinase [Bacteroidales bacterium]|nr:PAS domain-containing sensor histidine kinase [Bacteroidales bacterium]MBN2819657.1 PAS domain-containing sensor histidine kinase [Bacteroidales bacterium]
MLNFLNIIQPIIFISFLSGIAICLLSVYLYIRFLKPKFSSLIDLGALGVDNTDPLFTLLNNLPDNVYIKDSRYRYIVANDSFAKQLKLNSSQELIGKSDSDIYSKEIAQKYLEEDKQILEGIVPELKREQKSDKNGIFKQTVTTKIPLKNKFGTIVGLVGICTDVTNQYVITEELKKQNLSIEKERKLLRTLIDNMPDTIYIKDKDGCFLDVNTEQVMVTKAGSRENMLGKSDYDFYPKDIADIFYKDDKNIIDTGNSVINKEEIGFDSEGNILVKLTTKVPFYGEDGKIEGLVGIGRDITKLKETEEKLIEQAQNLQEVNVLLEERQEEINQQSEELSEQNNILESERTLLRTLIDNIPDFIYIKDTKCRFITANKFLIENFKVKSLIDLEGKTDYDLFPKEMADKFFTDDKNIIASGKSIIGMEEIGLDKDGNIMHILTTKVPIINIDGEVTGLVGIGKNITSIKETEIKLKEQAEYLKEVNVLLEERQEEIQQQSSELSSQNTLLENERNLLRVLIDSLPESIFIKDTESRFVTVNKAVLENRNLNSLLDIEGKTDFEFYDRESAQEFFNDEKNIFKTGQAIFNKEEVRKLKDGSEKIKSITKVPYFDDQGRTLGIVGISKDITKLKEIQKNLQKKSDDLMEANKLLEDRAEEIEKQKEWLAEQNENIEKERMLLRTLIDNMPDHIYIKDINSRFLTVNKKLMTTMHLNTIDEVIGKTDFELAPTMEAAKAYFADEQEIIKTGRPIINKEEIGFDESGREKVISTTKVPYKDPDNNILGIVGIGRDITKQKNTEKKLIEQAESLKEINTLLEERQEKIQLQSEELNKQALELKKSNKQLEELNATKNKFFSIIAHDLKNPFQAIFGFSELLMRNFEDFEGNQRMELLTMIKSSSESAYNLLENLLQWARTQTDRIKYNPSLLNIHEVIEQNVLLGQPNAEKKNISIHTVLDCSGIVWADSNMINLVIRNLISNAIKFTPNNGEITVYCNNINNNKKCRVSIADSGIGISKENTKKLFRIDEYFSTTGTAGESGTGLGLIICKEFVEKNKGVLEIESELNKGTTFSFTLPLKADNESN